VREEGLSTWLNWACIPNGLLDRVTWRGLKCRNHATRANLGQRTLNDDDDKYDEYHMNKILSPRSDKNSSTVIIHWHVNTERSICAICGEETGSGG